MFLLKKQKNDNFPSLISLFFYCFFFFEGEEVFNYQNI